MKLLRIYTDSAGQSHFDEIDWSLTETELFPPSPAGYLVSEAMAAKEVRLVRTPAGYRDEWHTVPNRVSAVLLSGRLRIEAGDGDSRVVEAGQSYLCEDNQGCGHRMAELEGQAYDLAPVMLQP